MCHTGMKMYNFVAEAISKLRIACNYHQHDLKAFFLIHRKLIIICEYHEGDDKNCSISLFISCLRSNGDDNYQSAFKLIN